jgi:molybdopterin-containing oxidoreductase family iron-sulfur binding subunit
MARWGMVIDLDKCTACQACVIACQIENNVPPASPESAAKFRSIHWIRMFERTEGEYPRVKSTLIPVPCMHCENPPCIKVCPVGATNKTKEGIVDQIYARCIGCRYCANACPYTVKVMNWFKPKWPKEMMKSLNPDVTVRPKGVIEKCVFCSHRIQKAKDRAKLEKREMIPDDYIPACAEACPSKAIYFGDLDDKKSIVSTLSRSPRVFRLMEDLGTEPKVFYLREGG